jgi:hypothetical protein
MRSIRMSALVAVLLLPAGVAGAGAAVDPGGAPPESASAAQAAAGEWAAFLSARSGCLGDVGIRFEQLDGRRGEYRTRARVVAIDPDVPVDQVRRVVVHELAHHAMLACGLYADPAFGEAFYASAALPASRTWFDYSAGWEVTPAEVLAEALTQAITGAPAHGVVASPDTVAVVRAWAAGMPLPEAAAPAAPAQTAPAPAPAPAPFPAAKAVRAPAAVVPSPPRVTVVVGWSRGPAAD